MTKVNGIIAELKGINEDFAKVNLVFRAKGRDNLESKLNSLITHYPTDMWKSALIDLAIYIYDKKPFITHNKQTAIMFLLLATEPIIKREITPEEESKLNGHLINGDKDLAAQLLIPFF